jgi:hypothetical protein
MQGFAVSGALPAFAQKPLPANNLRKNNIK